MKLDTCDSCDSSFLRSILEAGVPALCPACGPLYSVAKDISNSNKFSDETRGLAGFICGLTLLFVGAIYVDNLIDSLRKG